MDAVRGWPLATPYDARPAGNQRGESYSWHRSWIAAALMPTVAENARRWGGYDWDHEGHKWSPGSTPAGTDLLWWRSLRPRLHQHLPTGTILEIAPGSGRWTTYLLNECERLIGVDLTERCVRLCRDRFATTSAEFHVNDGQSLPMLADASVDLAFSFDSLVHAEAEQVRHYLIELARTLKPGGVAFLHHSNLATYANPRGGIPWYVRERNWRGASMSARVFREAAAAAGLHCVAQELVNWIGPESDAEKHHLAGEHVPLTDCFSTVRRRAQTRDGFPVTRVYLNRHFVEEWRQLVDLSRLYGCDSRLAVIGVPQTHRGERVPRVWRGLRQRSAGWVLSVREPLARSVLRNRCPDCAGALTFEDDARQCRSCRVAYLLSRP